MGAPRFSIVIPTRERADTLAVALRTCLSQDYDDYEVVVCDNCSSPATRAAVEAAASPKVRYVRAPEPLAMSANWELAVSQARGEYVTVLGDDDGMLSYALVELDRLLKEHPLPALRWDAAFYLWPTIGLPGEAHFLSVPLGRELRVVGGRAAVAAVSRFQACYTDLPTVYNAAVHRDLLEELRRRAGRVFANTQPDVYSGFALGYLAGRYLSVGVPMTVAGLSRQSNGVANVCHRGRHPVAADYKRLNDRQGFVFHPWVPELPLFPAVPVADSFLFAKAALFPDDSLELDRKALVSQCLAALTAETADDWRAAFNVIRDTLRDDAGLLSWFDATFGGLAPVLGPALRLRPAGMGPQGTHLHLSADEFGVSDVFGAARLCEKVLRPGGTPLRYEPAPATPLSQQVLEKEAEIRRLAVAVEERRQVIEQLAAVAEERRQALEQLAAVAEERRQAIEQLAAVAEERRRGMEGLTAAVEAFRRRARGLEELLAQRAAP